MHPPRTHRRTPESCPQKDLFLGAYSGDEDCLTLNVWAPSDHAGRDGLPVLVYVHGGGNTTGAASETIDWSQAPTFDGRHIAERRGAVVITLQYRLGALGFLALPELSAAGEPSGNFGLHDQLLALQWVQDNAAAFGGDPSKVLLFGESAGAYDACALLASPLSSGLFSAVALQSGACEATPIAEAEATHSAAANLDECAEATDRIACLRGLEPHRIVDAIAGFVDLPGDDEQEGLSFGPVVDGSLLERHPLEVLARGDHADVPLVVGSNADELEIPFILPELADAAAYADYVAENIAPQTGASVDAILAAYPAEDAATPSLAVARIWTDLYFTCPARDIARAAKTGRPDSPVYRYLFSRRPTASDGEELPATHAFELRYVFGSLRDGPKELGAEDVALSDEIADAWVDLASGDPNTSRGDLATWPAYDLVTEPYIDFDVPTTAGTALANARCDVWE